MEKINKELLIKEISSHLPYGVKAQVLGWDEEKGEVEVPLRVYSINTDGYVYFESNDYDVDYVAVDNCLLYLRPMSSMTEEEFKEVTEIDRKRMIFSARHLTWHIDGEVIDFFNRKMLDWRGLIPMGLALEAPEDMYK